MQRETLHNVKSVHPAATDTCTPNAELRKKGNCQSESESTPAPLRRARARLRSLPLQAHNKRSDTAYSNTMNTHEADGGQAIARETDIASKRMRKPHHSNRSERSAQRRTTQSAG